MVEYIDKIVAVTFSITYSTANGCAFGKVWYHTAYNLLAPPLSDPEYGYRLHLDRVSGFRNMTLSSGDC